MFPVAACKAVQSILKDSTHSMEEAIEAKGHAAFPTLDMVRVGLKGSSSVLCISPHHLNGLANIMVLCFGEAP